MAKGTILVIEDEQPIQELLRHNFEQAGYDVLSATKGASALQLLRASKPALILLDLMLPDFDGITLCKIVRSKESTREIPIVMLTARGEDRDVVSGLEAGADDYVTKPFNLEVLLARVKAVLRRRDAFKNPDQEHFQFGNVSLHLGKRQVLVDGSEVKLTSTEFRILTFLLSRPGWVFTRYQIVDGIQGESYAVTERAVDVQMVGLRRKLGSAAEYIETVRGVGYRLKETL